MGNITGRDGVPVGDPDVRRPRVRRLRLAHQRRLVLAFLSAGITFLAVAAIFGPMWRRGRLDGRALLIGGAFYLVYLALVAARRSPGSLTFG